VVNSSCTPESVSFLFTKLSSDCALSSFGLSLTVKSFLSKYEYGEDLEVALDDYSDAIKRAYYSRTDKEAKQIIDSAKQRLNEAGLNQFERYVENQRDKKGTQIIY